MKRLNSALSLSERTKAETEAKYSEIRLVAREFLEYATIDAQIIVSEYFQPKYKKTVRVASETPVDGRPDFCGRGVDGKSVLFEAHGISYRVCTDDNGVFNGSDEYAAKAAGNERIGSLQYLQTHTKNLNIPLIAAIDYFGFRVLAVSKLQCEEITFNDEGEVRKIKEDLVHGAINRGDNFVNKNKTANAFMKKAGGTINLMEHSLKGIRDASSSMTSCSGEIKIYRLGDQFYAKVLLQSDCQLELRFSHPFAHSLTNTGLLASDASGTPSCDFASASHFEAAECVLATVEARVH
jgi:Clustered mitochondria